MNLYPNQGYVTRTDRQNLTGHCGLTLWFTGLSASGKSTLAHATEAALIRRGCHAYVLDGDSIRQGLNKNLGFTPADRTENIRRIGEVAALFRDCGVINIVSFISPYRVDRRKARELSHSDGTFIEVFVDCPLQLCEQRDYKDIYRKARAGTIPEFTGISAPYEPPENPEIHVRTDRLSVDACVQTIVDYLMAHSFIPGIPVQLEAKPTRNGPHTRRVPAVNV